MMVARITPWLEGQWCEREDQSSNNARPPWRHPLGLKAFRRSPSSWNWMTWANAGSSLTLTGLKKDQGTFFHTLLRYRSYFLQEEDSPPAGLETKCKFKASNYEKQNSHKPQIKSKKQKRTWEIFGSQTADITFWKITRGFWLMVYINLLMIIT